MGDFVLAFINSPGFGVVLGAIISILTTLLANSQASKAKRTERALEVSYSLQMRQLNLLIDLQKALQQFTRLIVQCQLSLLNDGLYAKNGNRMVNHDIDEQCRLATVEVNLLNSQVQSSNIREKVKNAVSFDSFSNDPEVIEDFMHRTVTNSGIADEAIGEEIRKIQSALDNIFLNKG